MLERDNVHVAVVQEVGAAPVRGQYLLLNLEANHLRVLIAAFYVIDRYREAAVLGMLRRHRSKQVGCKRGDAALARQVVAEKGDGSNAGGNSHDLEDPNSFLGRRDRRPLTNTDAERRPGAERLILRGIDESFVGGFRGLLPIAVGSVLALDTTWRPRNSQEAF